MNTLDEKNLKIAYIGGGSRAWARNLMKDLAAERSLCGTVALYDIDGEAARQNELIGNRIPTDSPEASPWRYEAVPDLKTALTGADFVIISVLPGTFDEMESDVHAPEKYGVWQSVGDTTGPGGLIRALRTVPIFEEFALAIRAYAPDAWVINYTNPMGVCLNALYRVFPEIKAFGCCHEVFGTQELLMRALEEMTGNRAEGRSEIRVNVKGLNHYTFLDSASWHGYDLFPIYREFAEKYRGTGTEPMESANKLNNYFRCSNQVKFDLFFRTGWIAAAGDRHLAEFSPREWYLRDRETVNGWGFGLTPVQWRKDDLRRRLKKTERLLSHEITLPVGSSGEEGVRQIRAIIGRGDLITNVNMPNRGQIPNLPLGAVVETNACMSSDTVRPVMAGPLNDAVLELELLPAELQNGITEAALERDLNKALRVFCRERLLEGLSDGQKEELFADMIGRTAKYLTMYQI